MNKNSTIAEFFERSFSAESYPRIKYCPGRTSLCMFGPIDSGGMIHWRPVRRALSNMSDVLDTIPPSPHTQTAREIVSGYWSSTLDCWFGYEPLTLTCGAWNEAAYRDDQMQLRIHFAEQNDRGLQLSVPVGISASGSECRYAMQLSTGEVWLEEPHGGPFEKQADTLASFFAALRYQPITEDLLDKVFE